MADTQTATFTFELVSPEKVLLSTEARMVVIPGEEGDFGVLVNHSPLISTLRPGVVTVTAADNSVTRYFVTGGFADVSAQQTAVLAEKAEALEEISAAGIDAAISRLHDDLAMAQTAQEKTRIQKNIDILDVKKRAIAA